MLVYLIHNPDAKRCTHKIGAAADPDWRLWQMQTATPEAVLIGVREGGRGVEKRLHDALRNRRVSREWFDLEGFDIAELGFQDPDSFYAGHPDLVRGAKRARMAQRERERVRKRTPESLARRKERTAEKLSLPEVRERVRARAREWAARNVPKQAEYQTRWYSKNAAKKRAWRVGYERRPDVIERRRAADTKRRHRPEYREEARQRTQRWRDEKKAVAAVATRFAYAMAGMEYAHG